MFQVGDFVVYGVHGVCRLLESEVKRIDRKNVTYYVLEPVEQEGARFYVPAHNTAAVSKMKRPLTIDELNTLLQDQQLLPDCWIADENLRKSKYKELISSGDRAALILMVRTLHNQKKKQLASGRKFHLCDENFLRDAEKLLSAEFSMVLNIPVDQVPEYIKTRLSV